MLKSWFTTQETFIFLEVTILDSVICKTDDFHIRAID